MLARKFKVGKPLLLNFCAQILNIREFFTRNKFQIIEFSCQKSRFLTQNRTLKQIGKSQFRPILARKFNLIQKLFTYANLIYGQKLEVLEQCAKLFICQYR